MCTAGARIEAPTCQSPASARGDSAAGDRLFGAADILSDAPARHIPVPLSADPRPRCRPGMSLPGLRVEKPRAQGCFERFSSAYERTLQ
ncbi:hypothetical protein DGM98_11485 [Xanthomonas citri]|uniref:Uncharacterized protein n=1 Tax=Xanthomonas citri pv. phaseoli var. fuscans TaxID=473423 RepID=A0AB33F250_XANCI|nr:hypothetical protein DGM98_11485 [Xanthomonas citri]